VKAITTGGQALLQMLRDQKQFVGGIVLEGGVAPDGIGPGWIVLSTPHDVKVQLGTAVAELADVELGEGLKAPDELLRQMEFLPKPRAECGFKVKQARGAGDAGDQDHPGVMAVGFEKNLTEG
jgi:hypothetical protein